MGLPTQQGWPRLAFWLTFLPAPRPHHPPIPTAILLTGWDQFIQSAAAAPSVLRLP